MRYSEGSKVAWLIRTFDRGSFSHVALWSGKGVIDARLKAGLWEHPLERGSRWTVYRYVRDRTELTEEERSAIVERARRYCGANYARSDLAALAFLIVVRVRPARPLGEYVEGLRSVFGGVTAVALYNDLSWLKANEGRQPMVCSELVARAYREGRERLAERPELTIRRDRRHQSDMQQARTVASTATKSAGTISDDEAWVARLGISCKALLVKAENEEDLRARGVFWGLDARDAGTGKLVPVVTPGDLENSPDLQRIGVIAP
jgi:hypothetical protein